MKKLLLSAFALSASITAFAQWTPQATGFDATSRGVSEIDIVDANTVWCVAYDGTDTSNNIQEFTKTTDGGENWTPGLIDVGAPELAVNNLAPISGDEAWVSMIDGTVGFGQLYHTTDGGNIWDFANPPGSYIYSGATTASFQNLVHFFNSQVGIVQGDPIGAGNGQWEVYRTVNGGADWSQVTGWTGALAPISNEFGYNNGNVGAGDFFWFVTSRGKIYRSADQGATWAKFNTPIADFGGAVVSTTNGSLHFSDIDGDITHAVGILIATTNTGTSYSRYTTTDGGATWSAASAYTSAYRSMAFIPGSQTLVATGNNGTDYTTAYSTDLGATWTEIDAGTQRTSISFLNGSTGWAGGFNEDSTTGGIYKYTGAPLAVPTVGPKALFSVSPNPTNGIVRVSNDNSNIAEVTVYDLLGKQVFNQKFNAVSNTEINLSSLTSGAYILKATAEGGASQTVKIVKE